MTASTSAPPGLSFPPATFAQLSPHRFLHAHLAERHARRPNGRQPNEFRQPVINAGSLSHSNGSAVVRLGDTAVVCGVRGEILLAANIPNPPKLSDDDEDHVERLGLLVPNVELSTGCSQAHLPGNPPSSLAQSLSWRLHSLLHTSAIIDINDLCIRHCPPARDEGDDADDDTDDHDSSVPVVKAYWTLYIDILCMSLDGACFDAAWLSILAALRNTKLPYAYWDVDREAILCSPDASQAASFHLRCLPVPATFAAFSIASTPRKPSDAHHWILADPDTFEEVASSETVTITVSKTNILRIEKTGGASIDREDLRRSIDLARRRWLQVCDALSSERSS